MPEEPGNPSHSDPNLRNSDLPDEFSAQSPDLQPADDTVSQGDAIGHSTPLEDREPIVPRDVEGSLSYEPDLTNQLPRPISSKVVDDYHNEAENRDIDIKDALRQQADHAIAAGAASEIPERRYRPTEKRYKSEIKYNSYFDNLHNSKIDVQEDMKEYEEKSEEYRSKYARHIDELIKNGQKNVERTRVWSRALQEAKAQNVEILPQYARVNECLGEEQFLEMKAYAISATGEAIKEIELAIEQKDNDRMKDLALDSRVAAMGGIFVEDIIRSAGAAKGESQARIEDEINLNLASLDFESLVDAMVVQVAKGQGEGLIELRRAVHAAEKDIFTPKAEYYKLACQVIRSGLDVEEELLKQRKAEFEEFKRSIGFVEPEEKSTDSAEQPDLA